MRGTSFRYQKRELLADEQAVTTHAGIDPLTGLPVLIYSFEGKPPLNLHELESENIPGVLDSTFDGQRSQVAVVRARGYNPVKTALPAERTLVLDSIRALRDAAKAGVAHGDIRAERFLSAGDHVLIEGFGASWQTQQADNPFVKDIQDWVQSIMAILGDQASPGLKDILQPCIDSADACASAPELYQHLEAYYRELAENPMETLVGAPEGTPEPSVEADAGQVEVEQPLGDAPRQPEARLVQEIDSLQAEDVLGHASWQGSATFDDLELDFELKPELHQSTDDLQAGDFDPEPQSSGAASFQGFQTQDLPEDAQRSSVLGDQGVHTQPPAPEIRHTQSPPVMTGVPKNMKDSFVKNVPPGATYRVGSTPVTSRAAKLTEDLFFEDELVSAPRNNLRPILLVAVLLLAAALLALWAFSRQDRPATRLFTSTPDNQTARSFIVDVSVTPSNLPPVEVFLISGPPGTRYPAGSTFRLPGRGQIVLDQDGTWQLQARFEERVSEIVTFSLPQDRSIVISLPEVAEPEGD